MVGTWHRDRPTWWEPADGRNKSGHSPGPPRSAGLIMAGLGLARRHSAHDGRTVMRLRTRRIQSRRTCRTQAADSLAGPPGRAAAGAALPRPDLSGKLEALRLRPLTGAAAHPARAGPAPSHAGRWLPQSLSCQVAAVRSSPRPPRPPRVRHWQFETMRYRDSDRPGLLRRAGEVAQLILRGRAAGFKPEPAQLGSHWFAGPHLP